MYRIEFLGKKAALATACVAPGLTIWFQACFLNVGTSSRVKNTLCEFTRSTEIPDSDDK